MSITSHEPPSTATAAGPDRGGGRSALGVALVALVAVVALTVVLIATGSFGKPASSPGAAPTHARPANATAANATPVNAAPTPAHFDPAAIYAKANPGVVDITSRATTTTQAGPFGLPRRAQTTDTGTGSVIDRQGHILTADHVVAGGSSVTVTFQDGATRSAKVLGADPASDIAVLQVDPSGLALHPLRLGSVKQVRVGDPVAVIGDPFDVQRSLSTGVVSGLDRTIQAPNGYSIPHALQTDAAMNPGNSGGPVLDAGGRVIGIADQIATGNSGADSSTGVGFALPIDIARSELGQLERGATPAHASIGVSATDVSNGSGAIGALVQSVPAGGPAAAAGVRAGDRIVALGAAKITGVSDLVAATATHHPGDHTTVTVVRGGRRITLHVTLTGETQQAPAG
jgi:S1-C subfamily serine protease